jgi:hypothetical protein
MEGLPHVNIDLLNNQLGVVTPIADREMGIVLTGVAVDDLPLNTPKQIFSLKELTDLGVDEAYDTTNLTDAYAQVKSFYDKAGTGSSLHIMLVSATTTMASICDKANDILKKLRNAIEGYGVVGISRMPSEAYTPTYTRGFDDDAYNAALKAQELADEMAGQGKPFRVIISARDYQGVVANLVNLRSMSCNRVGLVLASESDTTLNGAIGLILGKLAAVAPQRNIARVKDGDLKLTAAYLSDGSSVESNSTSLDAIHNKGYIVFRKFANKSGYFLSDDPTCAPLTDDYSSISRGRIIDKAQVIVSQTYVEELNDDLETDAEGYVDPSITKDFQLKIEEAILNTFNVVGEEKQISGVRAIIDPAQRILENNTFALQKLAIRPKGYVKYIDVPLGYESSSN